MDILQKTQFEMNDIIKEKQHMIRYIVEGVFPFDDRYYYLKDTVEQNELNLGTDT